MGYAKAVSNEDDYLEDEYNDYSDYEEENRSKPDSNAISTNEAVIDDPPRLRTDSDSITIRAKTGDDVTLPCDVLNVKSSNVILWFNTTQVIAQNRHILTQSRIEAGADNGIKIINVSPYDNNEYKCRVLPNEIEYRVTLIVEKKNSVVISVNDREASKKQFTYRQGDNVTLECKYNGDETGVKIKWSLNGGNIHQHGARVEHNRIGINHVDARHAGTYQCLGDIPGKNSDLPVTFVDINVLYKPKTSTHRHHVNTKLGYHADLYCDFHANPIASIEWKQNSNVIPIVSDKYKIKNSVHNHRNRSVLHIRNINEKTDLGAYYCETKNSLGSDYAKVYVILEPETPIYEKHEIQGRLVNLYWLARSTTPLMEAILDYKLNKTTDWMTEAALSTRKHEDGQSNWKIHHKLEVPIGEWEARVRVKNQYGWSEFSKPFNFIITEDAPVEIEITTELPAPLDIVKPTDNEDEVLKAGFGIESPSSQPEGDAASRVTLSSTFMPLVILVSSILSIYHLVPSSLSNL
ncbi:neuroplastin [Condylostylus longicornis]|uniref:neuroplastin n=1 Tax=Condylostylus longicornis TaxID=2530218 RepID=UPI00244E0AF3|nr:neuroplastin [Condylostylus longicornis]